MSQETSDFIFGAVVLAIFLVFVFVAGWILNKFKNARFTKAWAPLQPIINGKVHEDGGGAASSYLVGTYQGWQVQACMMPNRNQYSGESRHRYNYFDVALLGVPGKQDWSFEYHTPILGFGKSGWHVETKDQALAERLQRANLVGAVAEMGQPKIIYQQRNGLLKYEADITPLQVPTPEMFRKKLEILLWLAKVNQEVNIG